MLSSGTWLYIPDYSSGCLEVPLQHGLPCRLTPVFLNQDHSGLPIAVSGNLSDILFAFKNPSVRTLFNLRIAAAPIRPTPDFELMICP
jgi:hypothetical protein